MGEKIFIVGAGLMGSGIAQVAAQGKMSVILQDISLQALEKAQKSIQFSLERFVKKEKITVSEKVEILARIDFTTELARAEEVDLVIEAVYEDLDLKLRIFRQLESICPTNTILATNTSALPISKIASVTNRPDKVVGMHFFSPVPMMKLLEIVRGQLTSDETVRAVQDIGTRMGKETIVVQKDFGGFIVNRIGLAYMKAAIDVLTEGIGTAEDIDKGMRLGYGMPMGPLELADLTGTDVLLHSLENVYHDLNNEAYFPPSLLKRMVEAGRLGRKVNHGFYRYDENGKKI
ncbi:3-hydroxyacyl-CoA dehydrogenase family protein [Zhaonella formicivorans]|uniref:3-hydroxyacyl-CoA dehydrogenase family protein n=1 Tax=Zhaonella formicivorans TaxID=2528593 RepID=UPI0010E223B3|nr:3-hydroxyacyl-CoA dehydrogenase family protein [Zhaonella formicivorans]